MEDGSKMGAKTPEMEPNCRKWSKKDPVWSQKGPKGSQNDPNGSQKGPKGSQKGPKGSQKDPKWSQKGAKGEPKGDKNASKNRCPKKVAESMPAQLFGGAILVHFSWKMHQQIDAKIDAEKNMKFHEKSAKNHPKIHAISTSKT